MRLGFSSTHEYEPFYQIEESTNFPVMSLNALSLGFVSYMFAYCAVRSIPMTDRIIGHPFV